MLCVKVMKGDAIVLDIGTLAGNAFHIPHERVRDLGSTLMAIYRLVCGVHASL